MHIGRSISICCNFSDVGYNANVGGKNPIQYQYLLKPLLVMPQVVPVVIFLFI